MRPTVDSRKGEGQSEGNSPPYTYSVHCPVQTTSLLLLRALPPEPLYARARIK